MKRKTLQGLLALAVLLGTSDAFTAIDPAAVTKESLLKDGWEEVSDRDGITTYKREVEGSDVVEFRGEAILNAPLAKVAEVLSDTPRKLEWVDRIKEAKNVKEISSLERIEYNHTKAPRPVKDRDFVFHAKAEPNVAQKTLIIRMKSVEDPGMPEQDCCVRGSLHNSSYVLKQLDDGKKTHVTVQIHADPRGSVPKWIVNTIQKSWPRKTLQAMNEQAMKSDVKENVYYKALFDSAKPSSKTAAQ